MAANRPKPKPSSPSAKDGQDHRTITLHTKDGEVSWRPYSDRIPEVNAKYPAPDYSWDCKIEPWADSPRHVLVRAMLIHHPKEGEPYIVNARHALKDLSQVKDLECAETAAFQRLFAALGFGGEVFDADEMRGAETQGERMPWETEAYDEPASSAPASSGGRRQAGGASPRAERPASPPHRRYKRSRSRGPDVDFNSEQAGDFLTAEVQQGNPH